ncbi:glycosyltransferase family 39 protein [bacterium]|nr:glycosyltransferase family 39 protein [bacterium]
MPTVVTPEWRDPERRILRRNLWFAGFVVAWTLVVYKDIYKARFFLDDYLHLHLISRVTNLLRPFGEDIMLGAFFRPGVFPLWKLNWLIGGNDPAVYYAVNIGLLAVSVFLVMQVMQHLTGNKGVAAWTALLFAVSPVTAIGILWLSNRFDVLGSLCFLLSLLTFLRYLRFHRRGDLMISLVVGVYGYFCKEITIVLPAVLALSGAFMFHYRGTLTAPIARRIAGLTIPYVVAAAVFMFWRYALLGSMGGYSGEARVDLTPGYIVRLLASFGDYVWIFSSPWIAAGVLFAFVLLYARRDFFARNQLLFFGLLFTLVCSAPLAMVVKVERVMLYQTPRFFYLPGIGLAILTAAVYDPRAGRARRVVASIFLGAMVLFFSVNSFLVTYHTKEKTARTERAMEDIHAFLEEKLPADAEAPVIYACRRGLDVALDAALKAMHPEYLDRAYLLNCGLQTQIIAPDLLYERRKDELNFPPTFAKNPSHFQGVYYGVVQAAPVEILKNIAQSQDFRALYRNRRGEITWVDPDELRRQMETMGVRFE